MHCGAVYVYGALAHIMLECIMCIMVHIYAPVIGDAYVYVYDVYV